MLIKRVVGLVIYYVRVNKNILNFVVHVSQTAHSVAFSPHWSLALEPSKPVISGEKKRTCLQRLRVNHLQSVFVFPEWLLQGF